MFKGTITLHYITLHYITLHYITLHCIALHYITLHYIILHYITLHYIILHYIKLHYILHYITYYITLHITLHYIALSPVDHSNCNSWIHYISREFNWKDLSHNLIQLCFHNFNFISIKKQTNKQKTNKLTIHQTA